MHQLPYWRSLHKQRRPRPWKPGGSYTQRIKFWKAEVVELALGELRNLVNVPQYVKDFKLGKCTVDVP
jgi:hypothetical protein